MSGYRNPASEASGLRAPDRAPERVGGLVTIGALLPAFTIANSPFRGVYEVLHHLPVSVQAGDFGVSKPRILWVNDGLMVFFFLPVALDLKREILDGHLSFRGSLAGPLFGAAGGVLVPALIYAALNGTAGPASRGWPIPVATDILPGPRDVPRRPGERHCRLSPLRSRGRGVPRGVRSEGRGGGRPGVQYRKERFMIGKRVLAGSLRSEPYRNRRETAPERATAAP